MCNQIGHVDIEKTEREVLASWGIYRLQKSGSIWSRGEVDLEKKLWVGMPHCLVTRVAWIAWCYKDWGIRVSDRWREGD